MTADTTGASTAPLICIRTPDASSTSITPDGIGNVAIGETSDGTCTVIDPNCASTLQLLAPANELARLNPGLASDRRRNRAGLHCRCNDAFLLGSRPPPTPANRINDFDLRLRHNDCPQAGCSIFGQFPLLRVPKTARRTKKAVAFFVGLSRNLAHGPARLASRRV